MKTENNQFYLLHQNQAAKEAVVNENFITIDMLLNKVVNDIVNELPETSSNGSIYIYENALVARYKDSWKKINLFSGMIFYVVAKKKFFVFVDGIWQEQ
jgi:hypothetical protein